jgi:SulP family sulfate permease
VSAGLVIGVINITIAIALAALIFSGPLAPYLSTGIGMMLVSAVVFMLVVGLTSSLRGIIAGPQDSPAAILGLVAAAIARAMPAAASPQALLATVVAAIALTSVVTGLFFVLLGRVRSGNLVRIIPYPVVGGFLAGTGWLLAKGALEVLVDQPLTLGSLAALLQPGTWVTWLPGVVLGVGLLWATRRFKSGLITPAILLLTVVVFYVWLGVTGRALTDAGVRQLLLGPFPRGALWKPLTPAVLSQVDWRLILSQAGQVGVLVILSALSLLLNAGGIELAVREDMDLNHELRVAGVANLAAGLLGGPAGYHYLGDSVLTQRMGARSRTTPVVAALSCALALFLGACVLSYIPKLLVGGLLLWLGLSFLVEWVYDARFKLSREDHLQVLVILGAIGAFGFLAGVGVGIVIALLMFVFTYSRVSVVKHFLTGETYHSTVGRAEAQRRTLREKGKRLYILQLHGFIFFGTTQALLDRIRARLGDSSLPRPEYLVLDFRRVTGFDASTVSIFQRIQQLCEAGPIQLIFTQLSAEMQRWLERGGLREGAGGVFHVFADLDHGVEWCEEQILAAEGLARPEHGGLREQLARTFSTPEEEGRFMGYLERMDVPAGFELFRQGDAADAMYFVDAGSVTVQLELGDGHRARLRSILSGGVVGEVGVCLCGARTGTAVSAEPSTLYRLSTEAIARMEAKEPALASALHRSIARIMAARLSENNVLLAALLD